MTDDRIDLSPFNLLITTPVGSRPDNSYNDCLDRTKELIKEYGGKIKCIQTRGVSDLYFARSKLFGAFLRDKDFTHVLMIDDDMSWNPEEVAWFLLLKRDMLAAVGTKKVYPIEFAWNMTDETGKVVPLHYEVDTNVALVPYVGAAFMMLSRNCAERLAAAYPELKYTAPDKNEEYDIFSPLIIEDDMGNRRRLADDFALCYRWRKIGGKAEVKLDVTLGHSGNHTFTGNLLEHINKNQQGFVNNA